MTKTWIPYSGIKGVSRIFSTYIAEYSALSEYYAGDWRQDHSYESVATQLTKNPVDRQVLVDVLVEQNARWENGTLATQLRDPDSLAVLTGQQVGIFGGPLYTLYKALTAIRLAEHLSKVLLRPVIPVFWIEGGDHDLDEVRHLSLPRNQIWYQGHVPPETGNLGSVGSLIFNAQIDQVRHELLDQLPKTEFREDVLDTYYSAYQPGTTFTDAFAHTLRSLLGSNSIVLMNPEDERLKELAAPVLRRELHEYATTHAALKATSESLQKNYHAQVHVRPGNVFLLGDSKRQTLIPESTGYRPQFSKETLIPYEQMDQIPADRLSPNVIMRPLVQDSLLPTVAYVAGPSEIAYFAQLKSLYAWAQRPMPIIFPRSSLTILEPRVVNLMERHRLTVPELSGEVSGLMRRCILDGSDLAQAFEGVGAVLDQCADELRPVMNKIDQTLLPSVNATCTQWQKELSKLRYRAERAEKRRYNELQAQIEYCKEALYPSGGLQERVLPALVYLVKYGDRFLDQLRSDLDLELNSYHQLLTLS